MRISGATGRAESACRARATLPPIMQNLQGKHIVVGVSGGIAAYKSPEVVRRFRDAGAEVRVVMTANSTRFVAPLTFQAVSGQPVHHQWLDAESESGMGHIDLARWADLILVAPATANLMARLAHGLADDLLTTLCITTEAPVAVAPAMNQQMWAAAATRHNAEVLQGRGVALLGPGAGDQACGETGPGRMLEPAELVARAEALLGAARGALSGRHIVVSAGPTWEAIDPVRGITNHSSGRMGYAVAAEAARAGARVTLVSGPVSLPAPPGVRRVAVTSAADMHRETRSACEHADVFIAVAAVADYRPEHAAGHKIKKTGDRMRIDLVRNPDILADIAAMADGPLTIGFAAETRDVARHAREKLLAKNVDAIAANDVSGDTGFGTEDNALTIVDRAGTRHLGRSSKTELARLLIDYISEKLDASGTDQDRRSADR